MTKSIFERHFLDRLAKAVESLERSAAFYADKAGRERRSSEGWAVESCLSSLFDRKAEAELSPNSTAERNACRDLARKVVWQVADRHEEEIEVVAEKLIAALSAFHPRTFDLDSVSLGPKARAILVTLQKRAVSAGGRRRPTK